MSETDAAVRGIDGDRRHNPFPSMSDTEYAYFLLVLETTVSKGVSKAMDRYRVDNCIGHMDRTKALEHVVFGSKENSIIGLDQIADNNAVAIKAMSGYITWLKAALTVSMLSLIVGLITLALGK